MSITFFGDFYYDNPVFNLIIVDEVKKTFTLEPHYIYSNQIGDIFTIPNGDIVKSIINDSDLYLYCQFGITSDNNIYCVSPRDSVPIIFIQSSTMFSYRVIRNNGDFQQTECLNIIKEQIKKLGDDKRKIFIQAIRDVYSREYKTLNEGFLVLYSQPEYTGNINIIDLSDHNTKTFYNSDVIVQSFINLTDRNYLINQTSENLFMYIPSRSYDRDISFVYKVHVVNTISKVSDKIFSHHIEQHGKLNLKDGIISPWQSSWQAPLDETTYWDEMQTPLTWQSSLQGPVDETTFLNDRLVGSIVRTLNRIM